MSKEHVMTIYSMNGAGCYPYTRSGHVLMRRETFTYDDNGKEEKEVGDTGIKKRGNTTFDAIVAPQGFDGVLMCTGYKRASDITKLYKLINEAYDDQEDYFQVPTPTGLKKLLKKD